MGPALLVDESGSSGLRRAAVIRHHSILPSLVAQQRGGILSEGGGGVGGGKCSRDAPSILSKHLVAQQRGGDPGKIGCSPGTGGGYVQLDSSEKNPSWEPTRSCGLFGRLVAVFWPLENAQDKVSFFALVFLAPVLVQLGYSLYCSLTLGLVVLVSR